MDAVRKFIQSLKWFINVLKVILFYGCILGPLWNIGGDIQNSCLCSRCFSLSCNTSSSWETLHQVVFQIGTLPLKICLQGSQSRTGLFASNPSVVTSLSTGSMWSATFNPSMWQDSLDLFVTCALSSVRLQMLLSDTTNGFTKWIKLLCSIAFGSFIVHLTVHTF